MNKSALITCLAMCIPSLVQSATLDINVLNPDRSGAASMILYAEPMDSQAPSLKASKIEITQKNRAFAPYITVMQRQDQVEFSNKDDFTHHIYSISGQNRFSFKLKAGESREMNKLKTTAGAETIAMGCNIHDWMSGFILVLDTPYFAETDSQGHAVFELELMGKYRLTLWHPQLKTENNRLSRIVEVTDNQKIIWNLHETFTVKAPEVDEEDFEFLDKY